MQNNYNIQNNTSGQVFDSKVENKSSAPTYFARRKKTSILFFATLLLSMIAFVPSSYVALGIAKTFIITVGTLIVVAMLGFAAFKERNIVLPPKPIFWSSILLAISLVVSSLTSSHFVKAFFGQGFEITTAGFVLVLFVSSLVSFELVRREEQTAYTVYKIIGIAFCIAFLFHILRFVFGPTFLAMSVFTTPVSTFLGKWNDLGIFALVTLIILISGLLTLNLSKKTKIIYSIVSVLAFAMAFVVNQSVSWFSAIVAFAIISIAMWRSNKTAQTGLKKCLAKTSWLPVVILVLIIILFWQGKYIAGPTIRVTETQYSEISMPWQTTLDVATGVMKVSPIFGIGPNHFSLAYMANKTNAINLSNFWLVEFNSGSGFLTTLVVDQGLVGLALWILFFVFLVGVVIRSLKHLPEDPRSKFVLLSSASTMSFLWIMTLLYIPSHAVLFVTFVFTGIFLATAVKNGFAKSFSITMSESKLKSRLFLIILSILVVVALLGAVIYTKKTLAFLYFASGIKEINLHQDYFRADELFKKALLIDKSDVYYQALAENSRMEISQLVATATSSSEQLSSKITSIINSGVSSARDSIAYNPSNYYNYVAEARISETAASLGISNAFENAVRAYGDAIKLNPLNPSLYVNLARIQALAGQYEQAIATIGQSLQVKSNYLDAIFLLSQIQASQGNLRDAIISAGVATEINPQNPALFFHLGLLYYNANSYAQSAMAFERAVSLQGDYANAKYFLGLSYARTSRIPEAIVQFEDLIKSNPENQEIRFILSNLRAGRSPFANAEPPISTSPEKRDTLPVKEE